MSHVCLQVSAMQSSGAVAVVVMQTEDAPFPCDMNCVGVECLLGISIPSTNIPYNSALALWQVACLYIHTGKLNCKVAVVNVGSIHKLLAAGDLYIMTICILLQDVF